jgi:hypothetical protein
MRRQLQVRHVPYSNNVRYKNGTLELVSRAAARRAAKTLG